MIRLNKLFLGALCTIVLSSIFFAPHNVSAYSASISTDSNVTLNLSPTGDGTGIQSSPIRIQSDCRAGYNLSIATSENSTLYEGGDNTKTATFTAVDGTSALSSSNNTNKWGYTLTNNATSSTVFSPLSTTQSVLKTSSQTASLDSDIDDSFNIYYGAKTDNTVTSGSYQMGNNGTIVYYFTMDTSCTQYTVSFNANGGTGTITNQGIQTGEPTKLTSAESLTAPVGGSYTDANNNTITGDPDKLWTFWGWNTSIDGTGDWYKDKEAVEDLVTAGSTITLYAQWAQPTLADLTTTTPTGTEKTIDHNTMQDMNAAACFNSDITTAENAPAIILLDYRGKVITDNPGTTEQPEQYNVSKLADGLCWMTTNLNLGRTTGGPNNDGTVTLTSDDTDLLADTSFTLPASTTTSNTTNTDATIRTTNTSGNNDNGTYYSWAAAVANTTSTSSSPTTSICPKNWDLPTSSQYTNLNTKSSYSSTNQTTLAPSSFLIDGGFTNGATFYQTNYSHYWTNTSNTATAAYGARVNGTTIATSASTGTTYGGNKYYRKNIRCVASMGTATINYNANNNSGSTSTQSTEIAGGSLAPNNLFPAETNKQFKEWNTAANGTGTSYPAGVTALSTGLLPGQTLELYAIWDDIYYISFNANESSVGETSGSATGTMANQTVVTGNATAIKTSTFALSGYLFYGWNTQADGNGTLYSDGQKVTNLTSAGNTVTLYAIWVKGAYLDTGSNVNQKLKRLAGNGSAIFYTQDTSITGIVRSNALPNDFTPSAENTISHSSSIYPIYAWYDSTNTTIYFYSEATSILMNKNSSDLFREMRALSDLSVISTWDTIKVTDMSDMFNFVDYNATTFTLDLSSWNTSSVTDMSAMFTETGYSATTFTLDLSTWNTSNVISMAGMFNGAGYSATTWSIGNLSFWDTSSVTQMSSMFNRAGYHVSAFTLDISLWNTSNVIRMDGMFSGAGNFSSSFILDLSSWDTSSVTRMDTMFYSAGYSATTWSIGDLSSWNTTNVTNMKYMFASAGCSSSTWSIGDLSSWDTSSVTTMESMFSHVGYSASTFTLDLSSWNVSSVTNMKHMFYRAGYNAYSASTFTLDLSSWDTSSVTTMEGMFYEAGYNAPTFTLDLSSWDVSSVADISYSSEMFYYVGYYTSTLVLDLSSWNTSNVTSLYGMFYAVGYYASTFSLDLSSWDVSSMTDMSWAFQYAGCYASTWSIDGLSSWDTSNVTNMSGMFHGAGYNVPTFAFDLSSWNTSSVTDMSYAFQYAGYNASTFSLDLSSWDVTSVTDMSNMFSDAGPSATTWSITIPKTNDGTDSGPISNTTSNLYGSTTSVTATPPSGKSFTLAN